MIPKTYLCEKDMRKVVLFILCLVCFSLVKVEAQIGHSSDTTIIRPKAPSRPELFCAFDEMSSEIIITPCTYTGLVSVTVTNIDTGAIALFTMASLSCGEERISFYGYHGYYLAEIEILSGRGRRYFLMINL